jgi:hypothetical protein
MVKKHLHTIFRKLEVTSRSRLMALMSEGIGMMPGQARAPTPALQTSGDVLRNAHPRPGGAGKSASDAGMHIVSCDRNRFPVSRIARRYQLHLRAQNQPDGAL